VLFKIGQSMASIPFQPRPGGSGDGHTIAPTQSRLIQTVCFARRVDSAFVKAAVLNDWVPSQQHLKFRPYLSESRCVFNGLGTDPMQLDVKMRKRH
jgi:hypothetical protein